MGHLAGFEFIVRTARGSSNLSQCCEIDGEFACLLFENFWHWGTLHVPWNAFELNVVWEVGVLDGCPWYLEVSACNWHTLAFTLASLLQAQSYVPRNWFVYFVDEGVRSLVGPWKVMQEFSAQEGHAFWGVWELVFLELGLQIVECSWHSTPVMSGLRGTFCGALKSDTCAL